MPGRAGLYAAVGGPAQEPGSVTQAAQAGESGDTQGTAPQANMAKDVMISRPGFTRAEAYMMAGEKLFKTGNYQKAIAYFYAVTKLDPKNIAAWKKTAFCYYQMGKHNYAYSFFQKTLQLDPKDSDALEFMDFYRTIINKNKKSEVKREMFDSIWRSALLPGLGQFNNNQPTKGIVIGGAFLISLGLAVYNVADEKMKYTKYIQANENQDIAYKEAQDAYNNALMWGIIAGAAYAGAMIDAAINYNCDEARMLTLDYRGTAVCLAADFRW